MRFAGKNQCLKSENKGVLPHNHFIDYEVMLLFVTMYMKKWSGESFLSVHL